MTSLSKCLTLAASYWETKRAGPKMAQRARVCVSILGGSRLAGNLTQADAINVLARLKARGLSPASIASYWGAFRRMLALNGLSYPTWPNGPVPPRRSREPLSPEDLHSLALKLGEMGARSTGDLLMVLKGTGMRVDREALTLGAWEFDPKRGTLRIHGKGGHVRVIPVESPMAREVLGDPERYLPMIRTSYRTHSRKWKAAVDALGITSRLPTPHAVRHYYATQAYAKCKDIRVVQDLLGHSDYATTARYIGGDMDRMREAVA